MTIKNSICECCNTKKKLAGVACVPGIPISIAWCYECLRAGVIPYGILITETALANGLENCAEWWKEIVNHSLRYFGKTNQLFDDDVDKEILQLADSNDFGEDID